MNSYSKDIHLDTYPSTYVYSYSRDIDIKSLFLSFRLRLGDPAAFRNFLCMDVQTFEELLAAVGTRITKWNTVMRKAIPPGDRLAVTLHFLATG